MSEVGCIKRDGLEKKTEREREGALELRIGEKNELVFKIRGGQRE